MDKLILVGCLLTAPIFLYLAFMSITYFYFLKGKIIGYPAQPKESTTKDAQIEE